MGSQKMSEIHPIEQSNIAIQGIDANHTQSIYEPKPDPQLLHKINKNQLNYDS